MRRLILVLGMHRSGTSCLMGALQQAGVYAGSVNESNRFNRAGNRELPQIMRLHDALFQSVGATWDAPPDGQLVWPDSYTRERERIMRGLATHEIIGVKDPRLLFSLRGWMGESPRVSLVGTFRHPSSVAKSLQNRNGFSVQKSHQLWLAYNRALLMHYERFKFPILSFDLSVEEYQQKLSDLLVRLELKNVRAGTDFFSSTLRHHVPEGDEALPRSVSEMYKKIMKIADQW